MSETSIQNPNIRIKNPNKLLVYGAAVLAALGVGIGAKKYTGNTDPFATNLPVPTESQPHTNYVVRSGDTESSIAARFGHPDDMNFENMLNVQLPKNNQHNRNLQIGENLRIPK